MTCVAQTLVQEYTKKLQKKKWFGWRRPRCRNHKKWKQVVQKSLEKWTKYIELCVVFRVVVHGVVHRVVQGFIILLIRWIIDFIICIVNVQEYLCTNPEIQLHIDRYNCLFQAHDGSLDISILLFTAYCLPTRPRWFLPYCEGSGVAVAGKCLLQTKSAYIKIQYLGIKTWQVV